MHKQEQHLFGHLNIDVNRSSDARRFGVVFLRWSRQFAIAARCLLFALCGDRVIDGRCINAVAGCVFVCEYGRFLAKSVRKTISGHGDDALDTLSSAEEPRQRLFTGICRQCFFN